ncbi:Small GTPase [Dillenia turbinata]|uniref:Small GTPase n=1 Tax=Dillenia turbinata TaxID=194707 RepID=A0AAN8USQ1_9MAGN
MGDSYGEECDYLFKAVLVGDSAVGKSNLLSRFTKNEFRSDSKPTIRVEFAYQNTKIHGHHRFILPRCVWSLPVDDITRRATIESLKKWLHELREFGSSDTVDKEDGKRLAELEGLCFMGTSDLENLNVEEAFLQMITKMHEITSHKSLEAKLNETPKGTLQDGTEIINISINEEVSATKHSPCCSY